MHRTTKLVQARRGWLKKHGLSALTTDREIARHGMVWERLASSGRKQEVVAIESLVSNVIEVLDDFVRENLSPDYPGTVVRYDWRTLRKRSRGGNYSNQFVKRFGDDDHRNGGISLRLHPDIMTTTHFDEYSFIAHSPTIGSLHDLEPGGYIVCLCCHEVAHAINPFADGHGPRWQEFYRALRIHTGMVAPWWKPEIPEPDWQVERRRSVVDPKAYQDLNYSDISYRREQRSIQQRKRRAHQDPTRRQDQDTSGH